MAQHIGVGFDNFIKGNRLKNSIHRKGAEDAEVTSFFVFR